MRVLFYRTVLAEFGGAERVMLEGLKRLRERGLSATLLLDSRPRPAMASFFSNYTDATVYLPHETNGDSASLLGEGLKFLRRARQIRRLIRRVNPDVIVTGDVVECRFLLLWTFGGLFRLPPIVTFVHGSPFQFADDVTKYTLAFRRHFKVIREADVVYRELIPLTMPNLGRRARLKIEIYALLQRVAVRMSRALFVLSPKNRHEIELLYRHKNVRVAFPGGYDRHYLRNRSAATRPPKLSNIEGPILLSICRLVKKKRVDLLIRAFAQMLIEDPQTKAVLVIAGRGDEGPLMVLADQLGISPRVLFVGFIPDEELRDWYASANVFVSADNADYDLTVMQAVAHGRNVVVSIQYNIPNVFSSLRRLFFLVDANVSGFAQGMMAASRAENSALSQREEEELEQLTWENYFDDLYEQWRFEIVG